MASGVIFVAGWATMQSSSAETTGRVGVTTDPGGRHVDALMNSFRIHADAASRRFVTRANRGDYPAIHEMLTDLKTRLADATFVTLFYTYATADGVPRSRTYYAMSSVRRSATGIDHGDLPDPVFSGDIDDYLDTLPGEVVARSHANEATRIPWHVPTFREDAAEDMQDAELKVVRSLESDLNHGTVRDGGNATVFVSRPSCMACSQAMNNFANAYRVSLVAKELVLPDPGHPAGPVASFQARQQAFLDTVGRSLDPRVTFRPEYSGRMRHGPGSLCVVGMPIVANPLSFPRRPFAGGVWAVTRAHALQGDATRYLLDVSDERYARWVLADWTSPYSARDDLTLRPATAVDRLAQNLFAAPDGNVSQRIVHDAKVFELGYTKSRPWTDVNATADEPFRSFRSAPSHAKASVSWNNMNAADRIVGERSPATGALYAVALQLLAERRAATTATGRAWLGLRTDIVDAVDRDPFGWTPGDDDLQYLAMTLDGAMREWGDLDVDAWGNRRLPVPFRVARMAAAYRDRLPYHDDPCLDRREHDPRFESRRGPDAPLCFNAATDRAVYQWFVRQLRCEMGSTGCPPYRRDAHFQRLVAPFRFTVFGPDVLGQGALDNAFRKELIDMHVVNRLAAEGTMTREQAQPVIDRAVPLMHLEGE